MPPRRCRRMPSISFASSLSLPALVLCLTGAPQLWIRAVSGEYVGALLVIKHAAQPVAESGRREPRRDARLAHDVHVGPFLDQQLEQRVPSPVSWAEEGVLIEGGDSAGLQAKFQQKLDGRERLLLGDSTFSNPMIECCRRHHR